jgi:hypothetical protein
MKKYYMIGKAGSRDYISVHFPSVVELLEYENEFTINHDIWNDHFKRGRRRDGWYGPTTQTSEEVTRGALLGDKVLFEKHLDKMISELRKATGQFDANYTQKIQKVKRRVKFNGYGDELDIHKVYQGQLDKAWRRTERVEVEQSTKLVTLFIQIAGIAKEDATKSLWRAATAVLLYEQLIAAGKSVKVVVGGTSNDVTKKGHAMTVSVTVKEYNEKLSLQRLAAMCHLGFYRTFGFGAKACQPYKLEYSLGYSQDMTAATMPLQFQEDIHKGHAKFVMLDRCLNLDGAKTSLANAYKQMKEFSK